MSSSDIAIVGMACRVPGAETIDHFWQNLCSGIDNLNDFRNYHPQSDIANQNSKLPFIKVNNLIQDFDCFDADFFSIAGKEAKLMDPQHRLFLECAWSALENSGYHPDNLPGITGLYAGIYANYYLIRNVIPNISSADPAAELSITLGNEKDHLSTFTAYKMNLTGPVLTLQSTCSSSLAAVHMACESLLTYSSDMMLAGGVTISFPQMGGYYFQQGGLLSEDGRVRSFDTNASGTVYSNGIAVVVLKRLEDAITDNNTIYATIKGSAVNNDGSLKMGYVVPSLHGQIQVIKRSLNNAGITPSQIGYIEGHGTGTPLGDSIELEALNTVFKDITHPCALGSVKSNIGHLGPVSGLLGLIKAALCLFHKKIPPTLHCKEPNPKIQSSLFYLNTELKEWISGSKRCAGISSFGLGGTNVHVILEEVSMKDEASNEAGFPLPCCISAKNKESLKAAIRRLKDYIDTHPYIRPLNLAYTLCVGRASFPYRFSTSFLSLNDLSFKLKAVLNTSFSQEARKAENTTVLDSLISRWQLGHSINWPELFKNKQPRLIPLPTYPFLKTKYWLAETNLSANPNKKIQENPAQNITEEMLILWKTHLSVDHLELEDNFFENGGSSLIATSLVTAIEQKFNVNIELKDLFENPTVEGSINYVIDQMLSSIDSKQLESLIGELSEQNTSC